MFSQLPITFLTNLSVPYLLYFIVPIPWVFSPFIYVASENMNDELPFSLCSGTGHGTTTRKLSCSVRGVITVTG